MPPFVAVKKRKLFEIHLKKKILNIFIYYNTQKNDIYGKIKVDNGNSFCHSVQTLETIYSINLQMDK